MEWLVPWHAAPEKDAFVEELRDEVPPGHLLWEVALHALAYRQDQDDVLFALDDGTERVAVVHLTYSVEADPAWPATAIFDSLQHFATTRMREDHESGTA